MACFNNRTPYTNFHDMNLDWIIEKVKDLESRFETEIVERIREIIKKAFVGIVYNPREESITFNIDLNE